MYGKANLVDLVKYKDAYEYAIINYDSTNKHIYHCRRKPAELGEISLSDSYADLVVEGEARPSLI